MSRSTSWFSALTLVLICMTTNASTKESSDAAQLLVRHAELKEQLSSNAFGRPLHLQSEQKRSRLEGDIYAEVSQPYTEAGPALRDIKNWCDILILPFNIKSCRTRTASDGDSLTLHIGRKRDQPLSSAQPIDFNYRVVASTPNYLQVNLEAKEGPVGTSDYRIKLELTTLNAGASFMHLSYSYSYGMMASIAMKGYLSTTGRNKIGFSIIGHDNNGEPQYAKGMRAVVERNTMRYFLAIEAFLDAQSAPPPQQDEKRLASWFDNSEQYAQQLHEIERDEYLTMKREEIRRQRAPEGSE